VTNRRCAQLAST